MKSKIIIVSFVWLFGSGVHLFAQSANPGTQVANNIANKMKDTLGLTIPQRNQIFATNMYIHNKKMIIRQQVTNPDSLQQRIQREERKRDSMYQRILPEAKFQLYLQKKRNLITAN